jgi:hypothetical protein
MARPHTSWTLTSAAVLAAGLAFVACNDSGTSQAQKPYFGPGSAPATPPAGAGGGAPITGPQGQPDDHGNDINNATFVSGAQVGVPPMTGSGALDYVGDVDVFQIYINAGTYDFSTTTAGDTLLVLLDANGNTVAVNDDEDPAQNKRNSLIAGQQIALAGIYYLVVGEGAQASAAQLPLLYTVEVQ